MKAPLIVRGRKKEMYSCNITKLGISKKKKKGT